jgi:hypothetical protein
VPGALDEMLSTPAPPFAVLTMLSGPQTAWNVCKGATVATVASCDISLHENIGVKGCMAYMWR